ncbi:hypothetical protein QJS10_CPA05g01577 [Acorus calamus]|uniref:Endonuclease/exonuclease/phosphatase n=1 Tax=Acorus calamus TaxID=4465 RepID=A0AAV9EUE5_ACOCL|nr:hypothetical protein QJS10_CPA05g01577 [Acorus calamus]
MASTVKGGVGKAISKGMKNLALPKTSSEAAKVNNGQSTSAHEHSIENNPNTQPIEQASTDVKQKIIEKALYQLEGGLAIDLSPPVGAKEEASGGVVGGILLCEQKNSESDFNEVRYNSEKVGGSSVHTRRLQKFNACISHSTLQDLKAYGHTLSWNNRQVTRIMCRLDRILVNSRFINVFPHSMMNYLAPGISDHSPMKVTFIPVFPTGPKPFKYFEMWESHPSFKIIVEYAWNTEVSGSPLYKLVKKLSITKLALKQWNKDCFGLVQLKLQKSRDDLSAVQALLQQSPLDTSLQELEKSTWSTYAGNGFDPATFPKGRVCLDHPGKKTQWVLLILEEPSEEE